MALIKNSTPFDSIQKKFSGSDEIHFRNRKKDNATIGVRVKNLMTVAAQKLNKPCVTLSKQHKRKRQPFSPTQSNELPTKQNSKHRRSTSHCVGMWWRKYSRSSKLR